MAASNRDLLPDNLKPSHYNLSIYDLELAGNFTYNGTVKIDVEVTRPTSEIVINSHQLKIHSASLVAVTGKSEQVIDHSEITYDASAQRATITLKSEAQSTAKAELTIKFEGIINNTMAGFYRSKYTPIGTAAASIATDTEEVYMYSTQFESCDARRTFPCFDEPNLKATFDFEIEVPKDLVAIANMDVRETRAASKEGLHVISFNRTPKMSTYLLAWAVGDFEYTEQFTERSYDGKKLPVRVYATKGLKHQTSWALRDATRMIDFYSNVFGIDYPLPKVDLLAVHEFSHGAMENWGLTTYRTTALLFDEEHSNQAYKLRVSYVIAHELAHQWFGDLVTMDWWNELWLNEGFATWVGWYATDHFYPDWNVWGQFVSSSPNTAMALDSLRTSHPVEVPLRNALEVDQIFDAISYEKGSAVIHMLSSFLGVDTFLKGVAKYLDAHKYANATTDDLWSALTDVSGHDVKSMMDLWIRKIGFPVVTVTESDGEIDVKQERFLVAGDLKPEEDETVWWIPLGLKTTSKEDVAATTLTERSSTFKVDTSDDGFYKLNSNSAGLFRTNYPPGRLTKLGLSSDKLSTEDKFGLIADAQALSRSGHGTTIGFLNLLEGFKEESEYLVLSRLYAALNQTRAIFNATGDSDFETGLRKFLLSLSSSHFAKSGWEVAPDADFIEIQLRNLLLSVSVTAGDAAVLEEARRRFKAHFSGDERLDPNIRSIVFRACIRWGGQDEYEQVKKEYLNAGTSVDLKESCLSTLGAVQDEKLALDFLEFAFSPAVAIQDVHTAVASLAASSVITRQAVWDFIQKNWEGQIFPLLSNNMVLVDRLIRVSVSSFVTLEKAEEIRAFFKGRDNNNAGYDRPLAIALDKIEGAAKFIERDSAPLKTWLKERKYI